MMHNWLAAWLIGRGLAGDRLREAAGGRLARLARSASRSLHRGLSIDSSLRGSRGLRLTLLLAAGEVLALRVPRHPHRLACLSGRIWATQTGCPEDHLLEAGGQRSFGGRGKVVVQAVRDATVRIECLEPVRAAAGSPLRQALQQG